MTKKKHPRISLIDRILTSIATPVLSARLKPLAPQPGSRPIAEPEEIQVPTRHGPVRCFVYKPHPNAPLAQDGALPPLHINIHGGGFLLGNPRQDEHIVTHIAGAVGAVVVNIDYSTAPAVTFPVAEEQCFDIYEWASNPVHAPFWDVERVSVSGGSAGGKLALNVLQQAHAAQRTNIRAAVLIVPFVDAALGADKYVSPLAKPVIGPSTVTLIQRTYFIDKARRAEPLASPWRDPLLGRAIPPTLIISGANDTLLSRIDSLVSRLQHEGAPVTYRRFEDLDHDFIASTSTPASVIQEALELIRLHLLTNVDGKASR